MLFSSLLARSVRPCLRLSHIIPEHRTIITSQRSCFEPPNSLLPQFLVPFLEKHADRTAIIDYLTDSSITHGQCRELVGRIANLLIDSGLKPGDHVALTSFNHLIYFPLMLGIIAAGGKPVLCNPDYTERDMEGLFVTGAANMVIGHHKNAGTITNICDKLGLPTPLDVDTIATKCSAYSSEIPDIPMDVHDTCCLFFSSGTTGFPKAVEITHNNFVTQLMVIDDPRCLCFDKDTVNNGFLPAFHIFGILVGLHVLHKGCRSLCVDGFEPTSFLGTNEKHKVTFSTVVPPIMLFLAKHPLVDNYDLSSITDMFCGAAPLSQKIENEVMKRLANEKLNIRQGYGLSETMLSHIVSKGTTISGSVGGVMPTVQCKIVDIETREEVPQGSSGEILLKGPCIMKGYLNNPKATKDTFTEDGFHKTGDIGYMDEQDNFYIIDRLKEFIKVKGFQVAPAELEALLLEHDLITDAAVIGIPDEWAGERPKAFVVKAPNAVLTEEDVKDFVAKNATKYKIPSQVEFIDAIPKLPSGKIQRKVLRAKEEIKRGQSVQNI